MSSPTSAHLPNELKRMIFSNPCLGYFDLLRVSFVNREWRSFAMDVDDIRQCMFLPCLDRSQDMVTPPAASGPEAEIYIDHRLPHKMKLEAVILQDDPRQLPDVMATPWDGVEIHPLLEMFRTYRIPHHSDAANPKVDLTISYQLLKHCKKPHVDRSSATWREMFATQPPVMRLIVNLKTEQCSSQDVRTLHTKFPIHSENGVTLGEVVDILWYPQLMRNIGLVLDDRWCRGYKLLPYYEWNVCHCYHSTNFQEVHYRVQMAVEQGKSLAEVRSIRDKGITENEHGKFQCRIFPEDEE